MILGWHSSLPGTIVHTNKEASLDDLVPATRVSFHTFTTLLPNVRLKWLNPLSRTSLSVLLESTNNILNRCAAATNKTVDLNLKHKPKSEKKPLSIRRSEAFLKRVFRQYKARPTDSQCQSQVKFARKKHRALIRELKIRKERNKDENLFSLLSSNPYSAYKLLKSAKSTASLHLPYIKVWR